jgi:hypothetical protein
VAKGSYQSRVETLSPKVPGIEVSVLGGDEKLALRNATRQTVVVEGYDKEPYLRFRPDGAVERNKRSPATYINQSRSGGGEVPLEAIPENAPRWQVVAHDGSYAWFDHRIHFTTTRPPPEGEGKIFDWSVPLTVDGRRANVVGALFWESGSSGGFPGWLVGLLVALAALGVAALAALRRRRARPEALPRPDDPAREVW